MSGQKKYDVGKTITKAAAPFIMIVIINAMQACLKAKNIEMSDNLLYNVALLAIGLEAGLVNWIKNRNRKGPLEKIKAI